MSESIIAAIKERIKIEELIGASFQVVGRGRVLTTKEHDSLKIWPADGRWWWFSQNTGGDVLDWYRQVHRCDLAAAIEHLARAAGIELRPPSAEEMTRRLVEQRQAAVLNLAAQWFQRQLLAPVGQAARAYCAARGWSPETVQREGIGYNPPPANLAAAAEQEQPLASVLRAAGLLDEPAARAVLTLPGEMLVYVHRAYGRVVYLAGRSLEAKQAGDGKRHHWNLPADLVGGKHLYHNQPPDRAGRACGAPARRRASRRRGVGAAGHRGDGAVRPEWR